MPTSDPRAACVEALLRWEGGTEFADAILHAALDEHRFSSLDRALFTELLYGVIRFQRLLDFVIAQLREEEIDARTRQVLRTGVYQLLRTRIPPHAAVNETVRIAGRARNLVNAVLRRYLREEAKIRQRVDTASVGVRTSHPELLVRRWTEQFGAEDARRLCDWNNEPAEVLVRVNELKVSRGELLRAGEAEPLAGHPLMFHVRRVPIPWIVSGLCYVQDPSTLMACEMLAPQPGERVLDACAAPGGKTSYLAQLMRNGGHILACDVSARRMERMRGNLERLSVTNTEQRQVDWLHEPLTEAEVGLFDRILLDAPCSNTGVIRRRVDVRWRLAERDFIRMPEAQLGLLRHLARLLKPGGALVYSTCSLEREENEAVAEQAARETPGLGLVKCRRSLPMRDGTDGAFAALFTRE